MQIMVTNGQILLVVIICVVSVIRMCIRKRNRYTKQQLLEIRWKANENRFKARNISDSFYDALEFFQNLNLQNWEKDDRKFIQDLVMLCELKVSEADVIEYEWKFLVDYLDRGIRIMDCKDFGEPSINIRRKFKKNYKKSVKISRSLQIVKRAEKGLRIRYRYLYLLPDYKTISKGGNS